MKTDNSPRYCRKCSMSFRSLSLYDQRCAYCSWSPKSRWTNDPAPLLGGTSQNAGTSGSNNVLLMSDYGTRKNYRPPLGTRTYRPQSHPEVTPTTVNIGGVIIKYLVEKEKNGLVARLLEISHESGAIDWAEYRTRKKAQKLAARIRRDFDKVVGLYLREVNEYIREAQQLKILL